MSMTSFPDFETVVTEKRLQALRKKSIDFLLTDLKEKYLSHKEKYPDHTWFVQNTIHGITSSFDLSYINVEFDTEEFVTDSMTEDEKVAARKKASDKAQTRKFMMRKQLFIYLLLGFNPYNKEWSTLKKKFNIEPMMFELRAAVRKMGYSIAKDLKLYVYFPNTYKKDKDGKFIKISTEKGEKYVKSGNFHMEIDTRERANDEERFAPDSSKKSYNSRHSHKNTEMTEEDVEISVTPKPWLELAKKVKDIPQPKDVSKPSAKVTAKFAGVVIEDSDDDDEICITE